MRPGKRKQRDAEMTSGQSPPHFDDVKEAELQAICRRREAVERLRRDDDSQDSVDPKECEQNLVGVALSGGGIRSAAFNLGVLQSLHQRGVLRFIDYLSAASGGSYIAVALADSVTNSKSFDKKEFALGIDDTGKPKPAVSRLIRRGNYLFRLDLIASRYFAGLILNLIPRVGLLVAVCAFFAFLWRCLDYDWGRDRLRGISMSSDLCAALLPFGITGIAWMSCCIVAICLRSQPAKRASHILFWVTMACLGIGAAIIVGNGTLSVASVLQPKDSSDPLWTGIEWQSSLQLPALLLLLIGLVPILFPRMLIRSGVRPRGVLDTWIFYYASFTLFMGIPLALIGWFGRENISKFIDLRRGVVVSGDTRNIDAFLHDVTSDRDQLEEREVDDLKVTPNPQVMSRLKLRASELIKARRKYNRAERALNRGIQLKYYDADDTSLASWLAWRYGMLPVRWVEAFDSFVGFNNEDRYSLFVEKEEKERSASVAFMQELNSVLGEQNLFLRVPEAGNGDRNDAQFATRFVQVHQSVPVAGGGPRSPQSGDGVDAEVADADIDRLFDVAIVVDGRKAIKAADPRQQRYLNRMLLDAVYPNALHEPSKVLRAIVHSYDQFHRLWWCIIGLIVFLISACLINPNVTNLHDIYRDRLAVTFLETAEDEDEQAFPSIDHTDFSKLRPHEFGAPYPLVHASVCKPGQLWKHSRQLEAEFVPFLISPLFVGSEEAGIVATEELPRGAMTIADAMAISGAAVSPNYFVHHIVMALMTLANLRMGKWVPNPAVSPAVKSAPRMLSQMYHELTPWKSTRKHVLLTDGGHYENLGLEALLERRCRVIIVCDAGRDPMFRFGDLTRVLRRTGLRDGIQIMEMDGSTFRPMGRFSQRGVRKTDSDTNDKSEKSEKSDSHPPHGHYLCARIAYPDQEVGDPDNGILIYVKPCLTGDESLVVANYATEHKEFPHDATFDQSFSEAQFEAYRQLGVHTADQLADDLGRVPGESFWDCPLEGTALFTRLAENYSERRSEQDTCNNGSGLSDRCNEQMKDLLEEMQTEGEPSVAVKADWLHRIQDIRDQIRHGQQSGELDGVMAQMLRSMLKEVEHEYEERAGGDGTGAVM